MNPLNLKQSPSFAKAPEDKPREFVPVEPAVAEHERPVHGTHRARGYRAPRFLLGFALLVVLSAIGYRLLAPQGYRAVFLANNQVYFGKFVDLPLSGEIKLTDVYYLQVQPALQPPQAGTAVAVVKLGNEIHGPTDKMVIPKRNILFWEDLRADSAVVKAIEEMKTK